ncbi:hypothetical protein OTU49_001372 [Cherax quadricarinatus]|uniref:Uncharacterized protein n=1 Tax=Cherax quadricarinatus TaxID=27406 RepID=A0AAW0XUK2_CHEQU
MNRFVTDRFDEHSFHTIGVEFLNKEIELGGETYTLQIDLERRVTTEEAEVWCKENGDLPYIETSAKDDTNVEASFMMCLRRWANIEGRQERMPLPDTVQLGGDGSHHRLCACSS